MFGGKAVTPVVVRTMYGAGLRAAAQHSQCLYPLFTHIPGLKVVLPSNAYDAKGLLIQAIRDDDPVIFFEHKMLYDDDRGAGRGLHDPFGEANVTREGEDVTIVARPHGELRQRGGRRAREAEGVFPCDGHRPAHHLAAGRDTVLESASRRPAAWSWWTRRIRAARWPPTSPRWSRRRRSAR
jgi:hypothetical protein